MDDRDERQYVRVPRIEDVVRICQALNAAGARYLLIGGFAVVAHGLGRPTKDIDLLVDRTKDTMRPSDRADRQFPQALLEAAGEG